MLAESPPVELPVPPVAEGFSRLPLAAFWEAHRPQAALYLQPAPHAAPRLLCKRGYELSDAHLEELVGRGVHSLFIANSELSDVANSLLESLDGILASQRIAPHDRAAILQVAEAPALESALVAIDAGRSIATAERIAARMARLLSETEVDARSLYSALQHDDRASVRAYNGAAYAVVLALLLELVAPTQAAELAVGAMLRDLGERFIPSAILGKRGRNSHAERELIESHPTRGYVELRRRGGLTTEQLLIVYQHHECFSGGGYPVGVLADEIHPWAQATAVVDAFDGLTGWRSYRAALDAVTALRQIEASAYSQFNPEMVRCWSNAILT
ncbi:MAG: hypothetical protein KF847_01155 [Pirellulales bacterium]|nr:hypothetical protein [Pirellulales bacterium]